MNQRGRSFSQMCRAPSYSDSGETVRSSIEPFGPWAAQTPDNKRHRAEGRARPRCWRASSAAGRYTVRRPRVPRRRWTGPRPPAGPDVRERGGAVVLRAPASERVAPPSPFVPKCPGARGHLPPVQLGRHATYWMNDSGAQPSCDSSHSSRSHSPLVRYGHGEGYEF